MDLQSTPVTGGTGTARTPTGEGREPRFRQKGTWIWIGARPARRAGCEEPAELGKDDVELVMVVGVVVYGLGWCVVNRICKVARG